MTVYEYFCTVDGVFEARQPFGKAAETVPCPHCGADARRKWGVAAAYLKDPRFRGGK